MSFSFPTGFDKPVCVFCASSPGTNVIYTAAALSVGSSLATANMPLVYGGGRRGLMGVVSHAALEAGGVVHGVLPRALVGRASEATPVAGAPTSAVPASSEGKGADLLADDFQGRLSMSVVGSMHERKALMAKLSTGGFVVLPGGFGTFEELFEMVTWNQIGMHQLPVMLLNIDNFYEPIKALVANGVNAGFIGEKNASLIQIIDLGDAAANADPGRAMEWGPAAVKALQAWTFPAGAGYGFTWSEGDKTVPVTPGSATPAPLAAAAGIPMHAKSHAAVAPVAAPAAAPAAFAAGSAFAKGEHPHMQQLADNLAGRLFSFADSINPKAPTHHTVTPSVATGSSTAVPAAAAVPASAAVPAVPAAVDIAAPIATPAVAADVAPAPAQTQVENQTQTQTQTQTQATSQELPPLFTTTRYTSKSSLTPTVPVTRDLVPLWPRHVARLRTAHAHFRQRDGEVWGSYPGDETVWAAVQSAIEAKEKTGCGDWRVRVVLKPAVPIATIEVQLPDANAPPYQFLPSPTRPTTPRKLYLDPIASPVLASETSYRLYKTERRQVYADSAARAASRGAAGPYPEVVLHANGLLLESVTSNIAILTPTADGLGEAWLTPALDPATTPLLAGTARAELLARGVVTEARLTVEDWEAARRDNRRVIGFNGLRGVYEAEIADAELVQVART